MLSTEKVRLGIAPIGWTNDDMPDLGAENTFEQCVSEMALAGYRVFDFSNDAKIRFSFGSRKRISISRRYILRYPLIRSIRCVHDNCRFKNIV